VIWYCGKSFLYSSRHGLDLINRQKVLPRVVVTVLLHGLQIMWLSRRRRAVSSRASHLRKASKAG
jgi:hypothetical protein